MSKELMLALPEVAYFVERVPVARLVVAADPIQLRFFQHARDSNMPLKDQCRLLGIPWHARKVSTAAVCDELLEVARFMEATIFVQCLPAEAEAGKPWAAAQIECKEAPEDARRYIARHANEVYGPESVKRYLRSRDRQQIALNLRPATLRQRAEEWFAQTQEAERARRREMNVWGGIGNQIGNDDWLRRAYLRDRQGMNYEYQQQVLNEYQRQMAYDWGNAGALGGRRAHVTDKSPIEYAPELLTPVEHNGFAIRLLRTHEEFANEGKRMHHCVEQYFSRAKGGGCYIVSAEHRGKKYATAEFTRDWELIQAKGPANRSVADDASLVAALRHFAAVKRDAKATAPPQPEQPAEPAKPVAVRSASWTGETGTGLIGSLFGLPKLFGA